MQNRTSLHHLESHNPVINRKKSNLLLLHSTAALSLFLLASSRIVLIISWHTDCMTKAPTLCLCLSPTHSLTHSSLLYHVFGMPLLSCLKWELNLNIWLACRPVSPFTSWKDRGKRERKTEDGWLSLSRSVISWWRMNSTPLFRSFCVPFHAF